MTEQPSLTQLIRRAVDDELPPEEAADLERRLEQDPQVRRLLQFETDLRAAVARSMDAKAPPEVVDRVAAALRAAEVPEPDPRPRAAEGSPRLRWMGKLVGSPHRPNVFYVAATIALVAGAVALGIFGPRIDTIGVPREVATDVPLFAAQEHNRAAVAGRGGSPAAGWSDVDQVLRERVRCEVPEVNLDALGYGLQGACACQVPGRPHSAHVVFRRTDPEQPPATVSLFVVNDPEIVRHMLPGRWVDGGGAPYHRVLCTTDGQVAYWLVCCDELDLQPVAERLSARFAGHGRP